jgi:pimeloyl-ACP methyl ester carboxylesterase
MRFVLVHGGFHGAWCWDRLIPELERLGHSAVAIDLPGHGARRDEQVTVANRRDAVLAVMEPGDVLVGHSGGGFEITLAADAAPDKVRHLIYLAAVLPAEGLSLLDALGGERSAAGDGDAGVEQLLSDAANLHQLARLNAQGRLECCDFAAARSYFYHDVDEASARWAFDRLTPAPLEFLTEPVSLPRFWEADLPRSFIMCQQDHAGGGLPFHQHFAERLGVEPLMIDSSHSPFLSKPRALAALMLRATGTTPIRPPSRR